MNNIEDIREIRISDGQLTPEQLRRYVAWLEAQLKDILNGCCGNWCGCVPCCCKGSPGWGAELVWLLKVKA